MRHASPPSSRRTTWEELVRLELLVLVGVTSALAALAANAGGFWLLALVPAAVVLVAVAQAIPLVPLRGWLDSAITLFFSGALALLVLIGIVPRFGLYRPVTVLSGSMQPAFAPGDMIFVTPERMRDLRVGQVITYHIPIGDHHVESHRVIRIVKAGNEPIVVTKGDANKTADPWEAELHGNVVWRERMRVPALGRLVVDLRSSFLHDLTVFVMPALLAVYGLLRIWRRPTPPPSVDAPATV